MDGVRIQIRTSDPVPVPWEAARAARVRSIGRFSGESGLEIVFSPGAGPRAAAVIVEGLTLGDWERTGSFLTVRVFRPELAEAAVVAALAGAGADPRRPGRFAAVAAAEDTLRAALGPGAEITPGLPGEWWVDGAAADADLPGLDAELRPPEALLGRRLADAGLRIATAESCTGGGVAERLTAIPGSSAYVDRGWVVYTNEAKEALLGVPAATLAGHGAVSEPVARALAEGALARSAADVAVSLTGIAGPSGGTPDKPVGTVWIGAARRGGETAARRFLFPGERGEVRWRSVNAALALALEAVAATE